MPTDTSDQVVGIACIVSGRVLITHDHDFRQIAKRLQISQRQYRRLHRIMLKCIEPNDVARLGASLSLIEAEWELLQNDAERALAIEITDASIRTVR